jgi:DNA replication protein DnaC
VDLLALEDLGMQHLPPTAAEDLLEIFVRRYEKGAAILTTNRPMEDWGQVLGDTAAAGAILDRFLHHAEASDCRAGATACTTAGNCAASRLTKP